MGRPGPQTHAKRQREHEKREKRRIKKEKKERRKAQKQGDLEALDATSAEEGVGEGDGERELPTDLGGLGPAKQLLEPS